MPPRPKPGLAALAPAPPARTEQTERRICLTSQPGAWPGYEVRVLPAGATDAAAAFPWEAGTVAELRLEHVAERLVVDERSAAEFWTALHRVCAHGALIELRVAPPEDAADLPAAFPFLPEDMRRTIERNWTLDMDAVAGFATEHGVSFGLVSFTPVFAYPHHRAVKRGKTTQDEALALAKTRAGVLLASCFTLIANKRLRGFEDLAV